MFVVLKAYVGSLTNDRCVDDWILKLVLPDRYSKYRLTQESLRQKLSNFRKSLRVQRRVVVWWGFWEAGFGLLSWAPWFRRFGERGFDQRRMILNFGDPSGQRHVGERRRDTHTANKVLTHGQTQLFSRYRYKYKTLGKFEVGKVKIQYAVTISVIRFAISSCSCQTDLPSKLHGIKCCWLNWKQSSSPPHERCSTPSCHSGGSYCSHEKQSSGFCNCKFHDQLQSIIRQTSPPKRHARPWHNIGEGRVR